MPVGKIRRAAWAWLALLPLAWPQLASAFDWQPLDAAELAMTAEPNAPGAPAICLYRQVDRLDTESTERFYVRIKILAEAGRKYADVEIPYYKGREWVGGIDARTISPEGKITEFDDKVYDKPIVSARGIKLLAKAFTLPDVRVGSIIEYHYNFSRDSAYIFDSHWILNDELYTRLARYSLQPSRYFTLTWVTPLGVPAGSTVPKFDTGRVRLEVHDVPAFATEEHMPPENALKQRVDFIYRSEDNDSADPAVFWKNFGKQRWYDFDSFTDQRRDMEKALATIVQPGDPPEQVLRKVYARVQKLRNLSFERSASEQENKHEKLRKRDDVADVWEYGYGTASELNWLYCALVRAAGLRADPVLVATRDQYIFDPRNANPNDLNTDVVVATLDGHDLFLDPGVPVAPFGVLPWEETAVRGLRLDKAASTWLSTAAVRTVDNATERKALLTLEPDNALSGTLTVKYRGLDALVRRREELLEDDVDRRKFLEDEVKALVPSGIEIKLTNTPDWSLPEVPLVAEFNIRVPGWATRAGKRLLLPVGLFVAGERHVFEHATRKWPIYYHYPRSSVDKLVIRVPNGLQADSLPPASEESNPALAFRVGADLDGRILSLSRQLDTSAAIILATGYGGVQEFFGKLRSADEQQVVLVPAQPAAVPAQPAAGK
jgi:hypothetical protein